MGHHSGLGGGAAGARLLLLPHGAAAEAAAATSPKASKYGVIDGKGRQDRGGGVEGADQS
jgi:hypothetical protein